MKKILIIAFSCIWFFVVQPISVFADETTPLEISSSINNTISTATSIDIYNTYTDSISDSSDVNWYQFTLLGDACVYLVFDHDLYDGTYSTWDNWRIYIYNYDGELLSSVGSPGNKRKTFSPMLGLPEGIYYIKVVSYHNNVEGITGNTGLYNLAINCMYNDKSGDFWEKEVNDNFSTANEISINRLIYGCNTSQEDIDFYTFTIKEESLMSVKFIHPLTSSSNYATWSHWVMYIYNYNGDEILYQGFKGNQATTKTDLIPVSPGQYYVKIFSQHNNMNGWHNSTDSYKFKIQNYLPISKASVSKISAKRYTGKQIKPTVKVKIGNTVLKKDTDYTIKYGKNKTVGTGTVTIIGKGKYTGKIIKTFKIRSK